MSRSLYTCRRGTNQLALYRHTRQEGEQTRKSGLFFVHKYSQGDIATLLPLEYEYVQNAVPSRKREFAAGRECARKALCRLGIYSFPLLAAKDRAPIWPSGVVGSITHTTNYCSAVVGYEEAYGSLGIDAEIVGGIDAEIWPAVFTSDELEKYIYPAEIENQRIIATTLFSAKEAYFKYQYQITREWLDFIDVNVQFDGRCFYVEGSRRGYSPVGIGFCRYILSKMLVVTFVRPARLTEHLVETIGKSQFRIDVA